MCWKRFQNLIEGALCGAVRLHSTTVAPRQKEQLDKYGIPLLTGLTGSQPCFKGKKQLTWGPKTFEIADTQEKTSHFFV